MFYYCRFSKCGHCGGLKIHGTWFDPGRRHQVNQIQGISPWQQEVLRVIDHEVIQSVELLRIYKFLPP